MNLFLAAAFVAPLQALMAAGPAPVNLGSTAPFTILAGAAITTTGGGIINGNVGASPIAGSAILVTQAQVNGIIYAVDNSGPAGSVMDPTLLSAAKGDLTTAYNDAAGRLPAPTGPFLDPGAGNIGGLNLVPGLYKFTGTASITGADVTLTGGPNDVWIFQVAADLEVGSSVQVILAGGAQAGNIFWQVGTSATIGTFAVFKGTILANQAITMDTSSTMDGRALAFTAGVTFDGTGANLPTPEFPTAISLQVTLTPSNAVSAGAQWQVDGGSNQNSGATVTGLSETSYIVSFKSISGWNTPADQTIVITNEGTTTASGLYTPSNTPHNGLVLLTNGAGAIEHGPWPAVLVIGDRYTVTAVPSAAGIFYDWVGGTAQPYSELGTAASYTFTMESNLVLEANFITSPFLSASGIYNGLFTTTNGVTEETAGMLRRLIVDATGIYSGTILIDGASHFISGRFDLAGQAGNDIFRYPSEGGPLRVAMTLDGNEASPQVIGTVSGTNWTANLMADLATNTVPSAEYTMLVPPDTNNAPPDSSPGGDGYAMITNHAGTATITGALADGTAFYQSTPVSKDGYVPIYANLYDSKGLLLGWINLESTNAAGVSLTWIHPKRDLGFYRAGFTNVALTNQILLSPWTDPPGNIDLLTNLTLLDTMGDTNTVMNFTLTISDALNLGEVSDPTLLSGSIDRRTGLLKVVIGRLATKLTCSGVIMLNTTNAGGYFMTATNAQAIQLEP